MNAEKLETVRGSGNVFRDLGRENADLEQPKALLAAELIKVLDRDELTIPEVPARTGFAAADLSRIRNAGLGTITVDRLVSILDRLGPRISARARSGSCVSPARARASMSAEGSENASSSALYSRR